MSLPVLQMREHVINRADRGLIQIFHRCASTAEIRPDRGRFSIATAVNEYGYQQGILEYSGVYRAYTAGFVNAVTKHFGKCAIALHNMAFRIEDNHRSVEMVNGNNQLSGLFFCAISTLASRTSAV